MTGRGPWGCPPTNIGLFSSSMIELYGYGTKEMKSRPLWNLVAMRSLYLQWRCNQTGKVSFPGFVMIFYGYGMKRRRLRDLFE